AETRREVVSVVGRRLVVVAKSEVRGQARGDAPVVLGEGGGERLSVAHEAESELLREVEILLVLPRRAGREAILAEGRVAEVRDLLPREVGAELQCVTTALGGELVCDLKRLGANPRIGRAAFGAVVRADDGNGRLRGG